jgi:hypothetical protein
MATDGVTYRHYLDTTSPPVTLVETTPAPTVELDGLAGGTTYHYAVSSVDDSGNESAKSTELVFTTPGATSGSRGRRMMMGVGT